MWVVIKTIVPAFLNLIAVEVVGDNTNNGGRVNHWRADVGSDKDGSAGLLNLIGVEVVGDNTNNGGRGKSLAS